jgi:hypothetical protein
MTFLYNLYPEISASPRFPDGGDLNRREENLQRARKRGKGRIVPFDRWGDTFIQRSSKN